jgi:hypothetical protein
VITSEKVLRRYGRITATLDFFARYLKYALSDSLYVPTPGVMLLLIDLKFDDVGVLDLGKENFGVEVIIVFKALVAPSEYFPGPISSFGGFFFILGLIQRRLLAFFLRSVEAYFQQEGVSCA